MFCFRLLLIVRAVRWRRMDVQVKKLHFFLNDVKFSYKFLVNENWSQIEAAIRKKFHLPSQSFVLIDMSDNYAVSDELLLKLVDDSCIYIELVDEHPVPLASADG